MVMDNIRGKNAANYLDAMNSPTPTAGLQRPP
jgi:hypothetical protein